MDSKSKLKDRYFQSDYGFETDVDVYKSGSCKLLNEDAFA